MVVIESTAYKSLDDVNKNETLDFTFRNRDLKKNKNILRSPPPQIESFVFDTDIKLPTIILTPTTPTTPKHDYTDPTVFYVSRDYFAPSPDHLSVFIDDELQVIEELPSGVWTRVRERDSQQSGLIPTDIIESGAERLAKVNKASNQDTIRVLSCRPSPSSSSFNSSSNKRKINKSKRVSFNDSDPEVLVYPSDQSNDHSIFPFTLELEEEFNKTLVFADPIELNKTSTDGNHFDFDKDEFESVNFNSEVLNDGRNKKKTGFFKKLFTKTLKSTNNSPSVSEKIIESLQSFEKYPDHLIRVYTGNFDPLLHTFKTFIVDESLTFGEFSSMVVSSFNLDTETETYQYELNLVNHLTAELIPLDLDFSIEQVIELTKREALSFSGHMPRELRKAQKSALKRLRYQQEHQDTSVQNRDKATDYVTPFKFVLNRIYTRFESVPIYIHVNLTCTEFASSSGPANLVLSSIIAGDNAADDLNVQDRKEKKKWYKKFSRSNKSTPVKPSTNNHLERILLLSTDPIHTLVQTLLENLQVPQTIPNIAFEASLPPVHDAIEFPLAMNISIGDALKIRPKLDQSQQVIIIRPVLV